MQSWPRHYTDRQRNLDASITDACCTFAAPEDDHSPGKENGKTTSLESPSLPAPHHLHLPLPITRSDQSQAPQTQSQLDRSLSVPASLPSQSQNKFELTGVKNVQVTPECMETQAEKQTLSGSLGSLLTPLSPANLSAPSQASLRKKHISRCESINCSSQSLLKHSTSDTDDESLPKRVLSDLSPPEVGMEMGDAAQEEHSVPNFKTKTRQDSRSNEGLEESPLRRVGEISSAVQPVCDPVPEQGVADRLIQPSSSELILSDPPSNTDEVQQPIETGKQMNEPGSQVQQVTEPSDMSLEIAEEDLCSWQRKIETGERPSLDSLIGNIESCGDEIEEIRHSASKKTESNSQNEKVHVSDQEFEDGRGSSITSIAQVDVPVEFTSSYAREKSEIALNADKKHEEVHLFTEIKQSSYQQDQASDSDSHFSPVATLFELHRELVTSCQKASWKTPAGSADSDQADTTNQEECVQLMEVYEECSDNDALSSMCVSTELETVAVEMEREPLFAANSEISPKSDNSVECSNVFPANLSSDVTRVESEEMCIQETKDTAAAFIIVSEDLTKEMEVSPPEEPLQTQELSVESMVYTADTAAAAKMSQSSGAHSQVMTDNVPCPSEVTDVSPAPITWEGTMEANVNPSDRHFLDSPLELRSPSLSNRTFPAVNVERIRRSGFTQQEAVEALERFHGNTDLALLVLLARKIVVPI
ncbi:protein DDI1 homolog 2 isoform X1 [Scyliorhinus canicula]|uniref:protein DDI1 homolog 2 isoform X1 n=1 Tax=Scyliorhinus canicula TaxID=7830 RepID=UPI0018F7C6B9|nr:protein DDI1 homolog 2 isoform X1 [Scyliorhinus canicula]